MSRLSSLVVLVVDDQESMRWIIHGHLKTIGINQIAQADSGHSALDILNKKKFDLILSDFSMDNGSGLDLLKSVRANPLLKKTPFIMVTSVSDGETVRAVLQAGANNYVVKPVSAAALKQRIEKTIEALA